MVSAVRLFHHHLSPEGVVLDTCPGPGPLVSDLRYRGQNPFPPDDPHGSAAFCMLAGALFQV